MKITWMRVGLGLASLLLLGGVVVVSGVVPVAASSGHWPWTRWFLQFAMSRSVSTHSLGIEAPALDDPALVLRGAGHYELGCSPCHGRPGLGRSEIVLAMTPTPPLLRETLHLWDPAELFYIVRHGVKLTAMPAWPVPERDDEVWAMVAFLLELPDLDEPSYLGLALGELAASGAGGPDVLRPGGTIPGLTTCARCHGMEGRGRGRGAFPSLAGQSSAYLANTLLAFARGERLSGTMHAVAAPLEPSAIAAFAEYFEERAGGRGVLSTAESGADTPARSAAAERGEVLARRGIPERKIPSCVACHGPTGHERNPAYPILAGQYRRYLFEQLVLFAEGRRGGTDFAHLMHAAVREMTPAQMEDVASYYASFGSP